MQGCKSETTPSMEFVYYRMHHNEHRPLYIAFFMSHKKYGSDLLKKKQHEDNRCYDRKIKTGEAFERKN